MKIFAATLSSVSFLTEKKRDLTKIQVVFGAKNWKPQNDWEPRVQLEIPDWHNGEYGDLVVQQWQVEDFEKRGYLREKMNIDMSTEETAPGGRGLVTWARLWKNYKYVFLIQ